LFLRHQTMDKVQKHNSFNTNTPLSESYRNYAVNGARKGGIDVSREYTGGRILCGPIGCGGG
jgi:hypothetical protein